MRTFTTFLISVLYVVPSNGLTVEVLSYQATEKKCMQVVEQFGQKSLPNYAAELLRDFSEFAMLDVLHSPEFPVLRLACFYEIKARNPKLSQRALGLLLAGSTELKLYEKEFQFLREQSKSEAAVVAQTFSESFGKLTSANPMVSGALLLRGFSNECLLEMSKLCLLERWTVEPTVILILEIERRKLGSIVAEVGENEQQILRQLKSLPGRAQTVVVAFYPFESESELLDHARALLSDEKLDNTEVVLSILDKSELVISNEESLMSATSNLEVMKERLEQLKKRMK